MGDKRVGGNEAVIEASEYADGSMPFFDSSVVATVETLKASSGRLYLLEVSNPNVDQDLWLQLFDVSGTVTLGTTTPKQSYLIPAAVQQGAAVKRGAFDRSFVIPLQFDNAIKYAVTTTPAGNGAPGAGVTLNASYR